MAMVLKLGGLLRRNSANLLASPNKGFSSSLFSSHRMYSTKLFVGGLVFTTTEKVLREKFSAFGEVADVRIMTHPDSGRSKGFGFVTFADESQAKAAVEGMNGKVVNGRFIKVDFALNRPRPVGGPGTSTNFGQSRISGSDYGQSISAQGNPCQDNSRQVNFSQDSSRQLNLSQMDPSQSSFAEGAFGQESSSQGTISLNQSKFGDSTQTQDISVSQPKPTITIPVDTAWEGFLNSIESTGSSNLESGSLSQGFHSVESNLEQRSFENKSPNLEDASKRKPIQVTTEKSALEGNMQQRNPEQISLFGNEQTLLNNRPKKDTWEDFLSKIEQSSNTLALNSSLSHAIEGTQNKTPCVDGVDFEINNGDFERQASNG